MAKNEEKKVESLSYEEAFQELEKIVETLETNQQTLEENMRLYERGQQLANQCANLLEKAELKVRQLDTHVPSAGEVEQ